MSNTVDNRVVEMTFDNKQFEQGIQQTITSLDNLKEALQFNTQVTGINTLQQHFNNFSLGNIESAVESLSNRFSTLGIIGMNVIGNLTNKAMGLASKLEQMTLGQITSGGKARAQKVADARFQLEGLFSKYEDGAKRVESAFDSASKAVDGTAYGLDAAVSTASQLATSGVELGDQMDTALRSIAGTAAMANSSFEEIGYIFTKVASKNKLQGDELISLSTRGINVLGILGEQLGKTQEEVQEMVSKGLVSFDMFSSAMNEAFGDQAQRANETLSGALSNVNSALSRIGELFYSGIIENKEFIEMVNQLRLAINRVKKAMEPLKEPFANLVSSASKLGAAVLKFFGYNAEFSSMIDMIATGMNTLSGWIDSFTAHVDAMRKALGLDEIVESAKTADKVLRSLSEREENAARAIWLRGTFGNGAIREQMLEANNISYDNVQDLVNLIVANNGDIDAAIEQYKNTVKEAAEETKEAVQDTKEEAEEVSTSIQPGAAALERIATLFKMVKEGIASVKRVANAFAKSLKKVFSWADLSKDFGAFIKIVAELGTAIEINDERAEKLEGIFSGLLSVVDLIRQAFWFVASILSATLSPVLSVIIDLFLWLGDKVGRAVTKFNEFIKKGDYLNRILTKIRNVISKVTDWLGLFFEKFKELPAVQKITDALGDFTDECKDGILKYVDQAADKLEELFGVAEDADTSAMDTTLGTINTALENMLKFSTDVKEMLTKVYEKFDSIASPIANVSQTFSNLKTNMAKTKLISGDLLKSNGFIGVMSTLAGYFDGVRDKINSFVSFILDKVKSFDYAKAALIGFAASVMTLLTSLSYFFFTFSNVAIAIETMTYSISGAFKALAKRIYDPLNGKAKIIRAVALALLALAASLFLISKIPEDRLTSCVVALGAMIVLMGTFTVGLVLLTKNLTAVEHANLTKTLAEVATVMMMLAASVLVLSLALNIISLVPYENLWRNLGILSLLLYEMVAAAVVLSTATPQVTKGGMSLLFLAGGVYILVASLQKLTELEIEGIQEKLLIVIGCLVTIGIVAFLASKTGIGSTVGVLAIVASIWLIELALIDIMAYGVTMEEVLLHLNQFIPVLLLLGIISGIMIAMGATGAKASGVAGVIIASAVAMLAIMFAIKALTDVYKENGSEAYAMACMGIIALFGMIIIMIRVLQKSAVGARNAGKALVSISLALAMMAIILYLLGQVNDIEVIIQGIGAIAALSVLATMLMAVSQYTERANPKSIAAMIGMIASMALIIALLSLIPDKAAMWESVAIFSLGLIELAISMYVLCNQAKKINEKKLLLMILMISTVALSILAIMKYNSDYGKAVSCAIALGIAIVAVAGAMAIMNKTWPSNLSKRRLAELAIMIGMVAVVGASLMGIAALGQNWGSVLAAGYAMTAVMIAMAYSMQIVNNSWPKKMKKTRLAELAIMIGMVAVIGAALIGLASLGDNWGSILASAVAMAIVMASVGAMMTIINSNFPKGLSKGDMASLAIIIGLVAVIGASLMGIASLGKSWASILAAALAMSASLMAFAGALTIMANIHILPSDAAAFALAAIALVPIASALAVLSQFNWAELGRSLILMLASMAILTSVMVVLAALEYALPGSVTLVLASLVPTLYAMAAVLLSLALSIMAFSKCIPALTKGLKDLTKIEYAKIKLEIIFGLIGAVALLGVGMVVFAFGLTKVAMALAVAGAGLAVFSVGLNTLVIPVLILTANLYRIVEAIGALGASGERYAKGLDALARSLKTNFSTILTSIVQGLIDALVLLASNQPKIISCLVTISTTLLALIYSWINKVVGIVVVGIVLISAKIAEKAPIITKNILKIIDTFLDAVVQYAGKLAKYAMMLVFAFVEGALTALELMFPSFLERIVSLVLTVIESIAQVLYNNEDRLCNAIRAVVDVVALTLMKILNEMFGGALENFDWYSGVEEELSASVQRTAAKQGELAAKTTSSSYSTQMSKEKAGMSDATSDAIGGAFDDTNDLVGRKAKITAGYSVDSLKEGVKSKIGDFKDYIQGEITDGFSINGDEIEHVAGETVEKATTYDSGRTKHIIETNISGATDIAIDNLKKQGWKFSDTAEDIMYKEYWTGVAGSDADEKTQSAFNSNVDSLTKNSTLSSILYGNGQYGTGQYYSGMLNIDSNKYVDELSKQSTDVVENGLVTPTEDALGIDSPSKVAAEISQYYLKGLVVGVKDNLGLVDETFTDLGNTISEDTKSSLYAFSDLLGDDKEWTPTITPVVDTTNIENARTLMNETFDDTSFKMAANANVTVGESSQSNLANQISNLSDKVDKLANKEYVNNFVVNADTTVDGTTLRKTSAAYTIKAVDDNQRAYIMSRGGRA